MVASAKTNSSSRASLDPRETVRSPTIPERVLQELRRDLARGRLTPGERVSVDQLAARFDVSPLPVREALRVLLAEGRVEYSSHRGFRVKKLTLADVEEIFLMCGLLESEAMRRGVPAMSDEAIATMGALLEKLHAMPRGEEEIWDQVRNHQDFHFVPFDQAGLPRVAAELRRLWDHTDHYRALYLFSDTKAHQQLQEEHVAIFQACAARDARLAVRLMRQHRQNAIRQLAKGLERDEPEPVE